ncbi:hypothetical protein Patl1_29421 [Pistacia atlantica]|uniref:Uncharacterized protein n=1 Tax=Pistacia atlantica TaxID=434234 RepID=A0ACC1AA92_9ROSI|nr:hypothetical protein Patl1_29421 [Pistacia atlantica]
MKEIGLSPNAHIYNVMLSSFCRERDIKMVKQLLQEIIKARIELNCRTFMRVSCLQLTCRKREDPDENIDAEIDLALRQAQSLFLDCNEFGDDRPLSCCSFSHDGNLLATCALSGVAKIWSMPKVDKVSALKGHTKRLIEVELSPVQNHLATASADRTARLWNSDGSLLNTFEGHLDHLARISFYPSGKYLARPVLIRHETVGHRYGSRVASSRRSILAFEGHVNPVLGISFSPHGFHFETTGEENTCLIWGLRKKRSLYTIPVHSNLVSQVKFEPQQGYLLLTGSYDMRFGLAKTLSL